MSACYKVGRRKYSRGQQPTLPTTSMSAHPHVDRSRYRRGQEEIQQRIAATPE
jgi:hypothetical protein